MNEHDAIHRKHSIQEINLEVHALHRRLLEADTDIDRWHTRFMIARGHARAGAKELDRSVSVGEALLPLQMWKVRNAILKQFDFYDEEISEVLDLVMTDIDPNAFTVARLRSALIRNVALVGVPIRELLWCDHHQEIVDRLAEADIATLGQFALCAYGLSAKNLRKALNAMNSQIREAREAMGMDGEEDHGGREVL